MKLHSYFRSSAAYRVRIALALKGLAYDYVPVHLVRGEQRAPGFRLLSADGLVPVLEDGGLQLTQSMAIIEYLDEAYPHVPLLPADAAARAQARALAQAIACEIHPLNNLRVLRYLVQELHVAEDAKNAWYHHWARGGLEAFEQQLARRAPSRFCVGDTPGMADCCLVPQIFNAQRFQVPLDGLPRTLQAYEACMALEAFQQAHPGRCPDAEP